MEINQLVYLVAIAEEASFSRAADRLGVAQPSISQQIKKLEEEVGTPLLDRLPRRGSGCWSTPARFSRSCPTPAGVLPTPPIACRGR